MKKLFLLFAAAIFLLFSCVSVQERPEESQHIIEEIEEDASSTQDASIEEETAAVVDAVAADTQGESDELIADEKPEIALADVAQIAYAGNAPAAAVSYAAKAPAVAMAEGREDAALAAETAEPAPEQRARSRRGASRPAGRAAAQPPARMAEEPAPPRQPLPLPPAGAAEGLSGIALADVAQIAYAGNAPAAAASYAAKAADVAPAVAMAEGREDAALAAEPAEPAPEQRARPRRGASRPARRAAAQPPARMAEEPAPSRQPLPLPPAGAAEGLSGIALADVAQIAYEGNAPAAEEAEAPRGEGLPVASQAPSEAPPAVPPSASDAPQIETQAPDVALEEPMPPAPAVEAEQAASDNDALFTDPLPAPSVTEAASIEEIEEEEEIVAHEEESLPEPSRTVYLSAGQSLEVWYPGGGWSFEGFRESAALSGIAFSSRRFEDGDTLFFFRSSRPGSFILEFSRFDIPTGRYIADSLAVDVSQSGTLPAGAGQALVRPGVVRAPDYEGLWTVAEWHSAKAQPAPPVIESAVAMAATERETENDSITAVPAERPLNVAPASAVDEGLDGDVAEEPSVMVAPDAIAVAEDTPALSDIRAMIDAGGIDDALSALDRFFAENAGNTDEALFLQGQALEANSPRRDMRRALSAYETLTQAYPLSRFWQDADRRIRYIRRFYIDMR